MGLKMGLFKEQQMGASVAEQRLDWEKSKYLVDEAKKAKLGASKELQQDYKNNTSYIKDMRVYDDAIANQSYRNNTRVQLMPRSP